MGYSMRRMAKPRKEVQSHSVLRVAFEAFTRGDVVEARALAGHVLAGKVGRNDEKAAIELAPELSIDGAAIEPTPVAVARDLISRSKVAGRPYVFVGAVAAAFALLVIVAMLRYRS
jgi:hypothetical protein